jgi:hypothetical protein
LNDIDIVQLRVDVDNLTKELKEIRPAIAAFKAANKAFNEYTQKESQNQPTQVKAKKAPATLDLLTLEFTPEQRKKLSFEKNGNTAVLRMLRREEPEVFWQIIEAVQSLGGKWISDKEKSRFEIELAH